MVTLLMSVIKFLVPRRLSGDRGSSRTREVGLDFRAELSVTSHLCFVLLALPNDGPEPSERE